MPEINLPTAAKQDSIKQTVEEIASQFPISGGTDFGAGTPKFFTGTNKSSSYSELVNITGKGLLVGVYQLGIGGYLDIIADGITVCNVKPFELSSSNSPVSSSLTLMYNFNSSLVVRHSSASTTNSLRTTLSCILI